MLEGKAGRGKQMVSQLRREKRIPNNTGWLIAYNCEGKMFFKISFPNADIISSVPCSVITASL